ncbi:hypothetical protein G5V57_25615 [Nordella sp. HKS 07]|uniref:hypothetical protein n=1 Tax=Nordella sp. HKS 07 TaxID=2712222 RepID=UPI0013E18224|nr:hypothetical protein [Nordella sp. HKS 07]QIG50814.1 hypothetical protein G5V57_25615 [Nordella sp. HKS 07]
MAIALLSGPLLANQTLPPQIAQAIKSWQQCAAAAYKAERQVKASKDEAADASFAACQSHYETVVARAGESGLEPEDVRQALDKGKIALKQQMTAH